MTHVVAEYGYVYGEGNGITTEDVFVVLFIFLALLSAAIWLCLRSRN